MRVATHLESDRRHSVLKGWFGRGFAFAVALLVAACGERGMDALEADARGYLCDTCTNRFRTDASVFADRCPRCGSLELLEVVGYVCPTDDLTILGPRGKSGVICFKCGNGTKGIRLPSAGDLEAWGASYHSRAAVSRMTNPE